MSRWLPVYGSMIKSAAAVAGIEPCMLAATVWQESNGGISARTGVYSPLNLYRYEEGFWNRYLDGHPDYVYTGHPSGLDIYKRRVSASYGIMQVLYATARNTVCHLANCPRHDFGASYRGEPESLMDPLLSLHYGSIVLAHAMSIESGDMRKAWLHYNGGSRPAYAEEAFNKYARLKALDPIELK